MNLASVSRGNPFQEGSTAVMSTNNQPLGEEKTQQVSEKVDNNHQIAAMHGREICVKNAAPPDNLSAKRSQGGVQLPTGGNCAQCA
ncbi:hypothetical protein J2Y74_004290 [Pseudomonas migulae]|nr:hypothetical protein [Pseudomonas migulae]